MKLPFALKPGRLERRLRRRHQNPLFAWPLVEVEPETLLAAQKADQQELDAFRDALRAQVKKAVDLPPNAGSDSVLGLKEDLEKQYEQACGLPEDHEGEKEALGAQGGAAPAPEEATDPRVTQGRCGAAGPVRCGPLSKPRVSYGR